MKLENHDDRSDYLNQFPTVLVAMLGSTIPIAILGSRFAMSVEPFWTPIQFSTSIVSYAHVTCVPIFVVPIVGMLCGATISGMILALSYILKEFQ